MADKPKKFDFSSLVTTIHQVHEHLAAKAGRAVNISLTLKLIHRLSYSHLEMIVDLDDGLKRASHEIECMRAKWSVRELKRQIGTLYYERSDQSDAFRVCPMNDHRVKRRNRVAL